MKSMKHILSTVLLLALCLPAVANEPEPAASIYVKVGSGTRLGKPGGDTELDRKHSEKLSKGFSSQVELVFNSPSIFNAGLIFNNLHSTAVDRVLVTYTDGSQATGDMTDIVDIWSLAPATYLGGKMAGNRLGYSMGVGVGIMGIRDKGSILDYAVVKSGFCMGSVVEVNLEYFVTSKLSIGFTSALLVGQLTSYKTKEVSTGNIQNTTNASEPISHIDAMLSVAFAF